MTIAQTETTGNKKRRQASNAAETLPAVLAPGEASARDVRMMRTDRIAFSSLNVPHREPDQELIASLRDNGVIEQLVVRPIAPATVTEADGRQREVDHELVIGERRLKGAWQADLAEVLVEVRKLTDEQALDLQTEENLHRLDLSPLQEAVLFEAHLRRFCKTVPEVAARVHKSPRYVEQRLKLLELPARGRTALDAGRIVLGTALEIACLAPEHREDALTVVLPRDGAAALPVATARDEITNRFHLRMVRATFALDDAELVPGAGPCTTCGKRTINQLALSIEGLDDEDRCSDRPCWEAKTEATWARRSARAKAEGLAVFDTKVPGKAAEAARMVLARPEMKGLVNLDAPCPFVADSAIELAERKLDEAEKSGDEAAIEEALRKLDEAEQTAATTTWRTAVGQAAQPVAVARDVLAGRDAVVELADERTALTALREAGHALPAWAAQKLDPPAPRTENAASNEMAVAHRARVILRGRLVETLVPVAEKAKVGPAFWRGVIVAVSAGLTPIDAVIRRRGWGKGDEKPERSAKIIAEKVEQLGEAQLRGLVVELLCARSDEAAEQLARALGVELKGLRAAATKQAKADLATKGKNGGRAVRGEAT